MPPAGAQNPADDGNPLHAAVRINGSLEGEMQSRSGALTAQTGEDISVETKRTRGPGGPHSPSVGECGEVVSPRHRHFLLRLPLPVPAVHCESSAGRRRGTPEALLARCLPGTGQRKQRPRERYEYTGGHASQGIPPHHPHRLRPMVPVVPVIQVFAQASPLGVREAEIRLRLLRGWRRKQRRDEWVRAYWAG